MGFMGKPRTPEQQDNPQKVRGRSHRVTLKPNKLKKPEMPMKPVRPIKPTEPIKAKEAYRATKSPQSP